MPGDPDTLVIDGEPLAGYAWSGPASECCESDGRANVAWQVWFTNTDFCPIVGSQILASLEIVSPDLVYPPSTELPALATNDVPVVWRNSDPFDGITEPEAYVFLPDLDAFDGTIALTTYSTEAIAGRLTVNALRYVGDSISVRGTFVAPRCSRIHD